MIYATDIFSLLIASTLMYYGSARLQIETYVISCPSRPLSFMSSFSRVYLPSTLTIIFEATQAFVSASSF